MKSVRTALLVFEEVAARQPVGLSELSRRLGVPKASVQRALTTLARAGWLRHDVSRPGLWVVTARFSVLADADPSVIAARDAARPLLRSLREAADGPTGFFVLDGDRMVLLAGPDETTLRTLQALQGPLPVHYSAAGRAILARLPDPMVEEVLQRTLPHPGDGQDGPDDPDGSSVDRAAAARAGGGEIGGDDHDEADPLALRVRAAIAEARRDGYALVHGEYLDDLGVVAAAVVDGAGAPVAAVAVMVPVERIEDGGGPALGALVVDAAASISRAVQAGSSPSDAVDVARR